MKGEHAYPEELFDVVVSAYHRDGFEPSVSVKHILAMFPDSHLTEEPRQHAVQAAQQVVNHLLDGEKVLVRCQAGLNRASLIAGLAMVGLGYSGADAVQLLRTRRSPWVLCNQEYATFLSGLSAGSLTLLANS
jgi:protein-tyrosine phosphatase